MNPNIRALVNSSNKIPYYSPEEIDIVLDRFMETSPEIKSNKKIVYYNVPCAFDIETSSFYQNGEKQAIMYEWTLGLNGFIIIGRTWEDFIKVYLRIVERLQLGECKRIRVYVHNLGFEFQFIMHRLTWDRVFAVETRKPVEALTVEGVEFRCSYLLSGYSLEKLSDELQTYKCRKRSGDLNYDLIRHSETRLTSRELYYCLFDVIVVMAYIQEQIENNDNNITRITLTKTGVVRLFCRTACLKKEKGDKYNSKWHKYRNLMQRLTLDPDEYKLLKRAFQGGFTHANAWYSGKLCANVESYDFTSSYPAVMIAYKFPMSRGKRVKINSREELRNCMKKYCCVFDIEIYGLDAAVLFEHPLSFSRCRNITGKILLDNGRIVSADHLITTVTEQDFMILEKFYTWDKIAIGECIIYRRGYLPTDFVKAILKLYADKTTLKGVPGKEVEYLLSKGMLNACYGMSVTDIVRDEETFNGEEWKTEPADVEKSIESYNRSFSRFLFYPWGVYVTAYARRNLFSGIWNCGNDYIYADTDSIKVLHGERHREYFERYNKAVIDQMKKAMDFHGLPYDLIQPKTNKGIEKPLGVWDREDDIQIFKTLGAKRYLYLSDYHAHLTVAGVGKKQALDYMIKKYGKYGIFKHFDDDLYIPPENTGKNTHTYIDDEMTGIITDYTGKTAAYHELSGIHLEKAEYSLSLTAAYIDYLKGLKTIEE